MIHQKIIKPVLLFIVISLSSFTLYQFGKNQLLLEMLMSALDQAHYSPLKIDDEFSEKAFTLYLKRLDTNKKFLLKEDVDALAQYKQRIDDEIQNGNLDFYNLSIKLIAQRIKEKENWSKEILSKPLDYSVDEEYQTDGEKTNYAITVSELKMEWVKMLKYQVLTRLDESLTNQEKAKEKKDSVFTEKSFDSLEVDARRKTLKANEIGRASCRERV